MKRLVWILLLAVVPQSRAETLRVPAEYATIQAAVDGSHDGDTVLVEPGLYPEQLAIYRAIVLKGDVTDTLNIPVVDPSSLSNPLNRRCGNIGFGVVVEDFGFQNGAAMYPREFTATGGIECGAANPIFRRCVFDSVHIAIHASNTQIRLENCRFLDVQNACVFNQSGGIQAIDCSFQGHSYGWGFFWFASNTSFQNCVFSDDGIGHLMLAHGNDIRIQDCLFTNIGPTALQVLQIGGSNLLFENNIFEHCRIATDLFLINLACDSLCEIRGNLFQNIMPMPQYPNQYGRVIDGIAGLDTVVCGNIIVENNVFGQCQSQAAVMSGESEFRHNQIDECIPGGLFCWISTFGRHFIRDNLWTRLSRGLSSEHGVVNAEWNWWGDETGPYHETRNPGGRGSSVQGEEWNLDFDPWYTDTLFWNSSSPEPHPQLPSEVKLSVYPNPFNSITTLELFVPKAQIVEVTLYDLLGREVKQLFKGPAIDVKRIAVDAQDLASGIYFARASDPIRQKSLAEIKMLLVK